jgi:hypothetical protein
LLRKTAQERIEERRTLLSSVNCTYTVQCTKVVLFVPVEDFVREGVKSLEQSDLFLDVYVRDSYTHIDQERPNSFLLSHNFFFSKKLMIKGFCDTTSE